MFHTICNIWVWPDLKHAVQQYVAQCPQCNEHARGKPTQPTPDLPEAMLEVGPMDRLGTDLFHLNGKDYLILVDFFSGFKWCAELRKLDSAEIIKRLEHWFAQGCGLPPTIRSDSGPQFRSKYNKWLEDMGIIRETSSAYNPQSNGLAKKAVQDIKKILKKQTGGFNLEKLVAEANNTFRANMLATPAAMFMG